MSVNIRSISLDNFSYNEIIITFDMKYKLVIKL